MAKRSTISAHWRKLFRLIPGYDPVVTAASGQWFDADAAQLACDFFGDCLKHVEGAKAGEPLMLEPWQVAVIGCVFGWKNQDGTRRYREVFLYVPRKNGKSTLVAGLVLYMLCCDNEPGAQIYSAAADQAQAALIYRQAKGMVLQEPELAKRLKIYHTFKSIERPETNSVYKAISAEADTKHGLNVHCAVIDELHAQPNRELVDVLMTGTGARRQPLIVHITTADFAGESICNEKLDYARRVRDGDARDPSFLPVVYEAAIEDDWKSPKVWRKANPNLGVSVSEDYLKRECRRAVETPSYENTFRRLHLNVQTEQESRWIPMDRWDACTGEEPYAETWTDDLRGRPCFAGLDLSSTTDMTALVLDFPEDGHRIVPFFWIPEETAAMLERKYAVPFSVWKRAGLIEHTPGNTIDYDAVRQRILWVRDTFDLRMCGYDPWNARQICINLHEQDGVPMVEVRQGYASLNEPSKKLEALMTSGQLRHGGHAVLRWHASNVSVMTDPAGNIKPVKPDRNKGPARIDGIVALVEAIGCWMAHGVEVCSDSPFWSVGV